MAKKGKFANKKSWSLISWGTPPRESKKDSPKPAKQSSAKPVKKTPEKKPKPEKQPPLPAELPAQEEAPLTPARKVWEIVKTILTYLIMAVAVAMMIFTAISVTSFDRNDRDIFGYKAFIVRSDSMSATDFSAGDLVIIQEVDPNTLQAGDIIAFQSDDPDSYGETFTHKIRQVNTDEYGQRSFITYGTTTGVDDTYPAAASRVLGIYRVAVPKMGTFFAFMKTTPGYICCIFLPFLAMMAINGGSMIKGFRQMYKEKSEAAQAEHQAKMDALAAQQAAIEAQQRQMAAMLMEMRELQAKMEQKDPPQ